MHSTSSCAHKIKEIKILKTNNEVSSEIPDLIARNLKLNNLVCLHIEFLNFLFYLLLKQYLNDINIIKFLFL